ncbi:MAG: hypothetical protein ACREBN_08715, partial [Burkholderiaceae bacterium]
MVGQPFVLKTTPPRTHRRALVRPKLTEFWQAADECSAFLVEAPGGFGKTTLLSQWRRLWLERGCSVAWVTLDGDDDPARFNNLLIFALRVASGRSVFDTLLAQSRSREGDDLELLTEVLSEIANLATPTVLMLDDAERMPAETVESSLAYLLLNTPANLQIVIGSRTALRLPTAELLARDSLRRLTPRELRLELEESVAILRSRFADRLSLDDCAKLHEITEGWPLGLQLAAAAIEHDDNLSRAVQQLTGRHSEIERYFVESLLDRLPGEQRNFLVQIAMLDYLTTELCEHVTQCASTAMFLDQLISQTPIVIVAEMRGWIRLHPLARDFLQSRFEALPETERRELHLRATDWLARNGFFHEAGQHALAAGEEARARGFAEQSIWDLAMRGRLGEARQWLRHLPQAISGTDTALRLSSIWIMAIGDRPQEALGLAESMAAEPDHDRQTHFILALISACAAGFCDKPGLMERAMAPWIDAPADLSEPIHVMSYVNTLGYMALFRGDPQESRRVFSATPVLDAAATSIDMASALGYMIIAVGHLWDGNAFKAESCLQRPLQLAERAMGRRSVPASVLAAFLAGALSERGDDELAESLLANRLDVIERTAIPDSVLIAYRTLATLAWRRGDERRALEVLESLRTLGAERGMPRLVMTALAEAVRIHALAARPETARERLTLLESMRSAFRRDEFATFLPLFDLTVAIGRAYVALTSGEIGVANDALKRADTIAAKSGRGREAIVIKALRAVAADEQGHRERAEALIKEAAGLAAIGGLTRCLTDTHPRAAAIAAGGKTPAQPQPAEPVRYADPAPMRSATVAGGLLTPKEAKILGLLS